MAYPLTFKTLVNTVENKILSVHSFLAPFKTASDEDPE